MCCKDTWRRWQWCLLKIPEGVDSDVLLRYLEEVVVVVKIPGEGTRGKGPLY